MNSLLASNIRRNIKTYMFYYLALMLNVVMVNVFISISNSDNLMFFLMNAKSEITAAFKSAYIIIALFSMVFIIYCTNYFIKKRTKEIALYSLFGMKKTDIALLIVVENIIVGVSATITGIFLGIFLSKFMMMILANHLGLSFFIEFELKANSIILTFIIYFSIFIVSSIAIFTKVIQSSLLDLFKGEHRGEKPLKGSYTIGIIAVVMLILGYSIGIYVSYNPAYFPQGILATLVLSILGTFLFFSNFMTKALDTIISKSNALYYDGNIIWLRRITHRIRTSYKIISIITILIASTLTAVGITNAISMQLDNFFNYTAKYDLNYITESKQVHDKVNRILETSRHKIVHNNNYESKKLTLNNIEYNVYSDKYFSDIDLDPLVGKIYSLSTNVSEKTEGFVFSTEYGELTINEYSRKPYFNSFPIYLVMIVDDEFYQAIDSSIYYTKALKYDSHIDAIDELNSIADVLTDIDHSIVLRDLSVLYVFKIIAFVSMFIGVIFIVSSATILYIKIVGTNIEDRESFTTLSNIGFSNKDIKLQLTKYARTIYYLPLIMGSLHAGVALLMLKVLLESNSDSFMYSNIVIPTAALFMVIYGLYYAFYRLTLAKSFKDSL